uniref:SUMO specific peptidase 6 n=1 Tax=Sphenodon punctatus TaxID=8508 RepID=A0A8D0HTL9_SPHPU
MRIGHSMKQCENAQNISSPGTMVHGRRFHHAHAQTSAVKTAAQSNLDRKESLMENREESEFELESGVKRKVQQKRHCNSYQSDFPPSPATKKCLTHLEDSEQTDYPTSCPRCGKANENQTKCQSCGSIFLKDLQRHSRQAVSLSDLGPLSRASIHPNSTGQNPLNTGLNSKKFYSSTVGKASVDFIPRRDIGHPMLRPNGKVGLLKGAKNSKIIGSLRQRSAKPSELNDPIILSSDDDEDDNDSGSTNRMESISPHPADLARSSPAPSTGKVEAALKENTCGVEQRLNSITAETELAVTLPRKARMKDQFGNNVPKTPLKRRKVTSQETVADAVSLNYHNSYESVILNCRNIRIGTLQRMVAEPVIFCLDYIKIQLEDSENDIREINLKTSELTKCEWCSVRKLPVVFLQTVAAACLSLRAQLKMSREKDNVWYDCKGANPEEQYIILIFETGLDPHENTIFEKIIADIGVRNNISDFFIKIPFEEANGRLVAFTKSFEETSKGSAAHKENKIKNVVSESRIQTRNATQFQFFDDDEEIGEPHTVFIGPIEKLIVYPPPPAKGGISVTNEDLHCLNEGEFLNDVIIDFYLKYLVLEKLKKEDADRIHVFSSFFYKRLNQRERRNLHKTTNLSIQQKRHGRVKTWTRHVDIFDKDFIFVPLNEALHAKTWSKTRLQGIQKTGMVQMPLKLLSHHLFNNLS